MKPRRTVVGAAALSLAVAGSLAGAGSARADEVCLYCPPPTAGSFAALSGVIQKFESPLVKFDSPFWKLETPLARIKYLLDKASPD